MSPRLRGLCAAIGYLARNQGLPMSVPASAFVLDPGSISFSLG